MGSNRELVEQMLECYAGMETAGLESILHEEAKHTAPGSDFGANLVGRSKIIDYFKQNVFPSFNRVAFDVVFLWEDEQKDVVVVEWRSHLWPKTGKNYTNTGVFVIEIKDGKVYWVREYFDTEKAHRHVSGD